MNKTIEFVMEASPIAMMVFNYREQVEFANSAARRMFQSRPDPSAEDDCGGFIACTNSTKAPRGCGHSRVCTYCPLVPAVRKALNAAHGTVIAQGEVQLVCAPDDRAIWVKYKVCGMDLDGQSGAVLALDDITRHKTTAQALETRERQLSQAMETARLGYWEYDIVNDVFTFNDHFYKVFRTSADEVGGYTMRFEDYVRRFVHPDDVALAFGETEKAKETHTTDQSRMIEHRIIYGDGETGIINVHYFIVKDDQGRPIKTYGVDQDVTELKRIETRLQQSQKMESLGVLAGGIAHDFNNILVPIMGMSEMLIDDLPEGQAELEKAKVIYKASKRGSELVKQILAFSRQSEPIKAPIKLQPILAETLKLARATIPTDIEIFHQLEDQCGMVMGDPTQIHQIALNLLTNAYHAVEQNEGCISMTLKQREITGNDPEPVALEPGAYAVLTVSDTGHGIPNEAIDKIFEPYYSTKKREKGTGLGLSLVYGIVKDYGGDIRVFSEVNKGTTFQIYLPIIDETNGADLPSKPRRYEFGTESILLVDDEEPIVQIEKQMLERLGYRVTSRVSSIDALEAFKANSTAYDLVMTDMSMPNMTGDQLAVKMLALRPDLPIIICTGFSDRISREKALQLGIRGFLLKPVAMADLAATIRRALEGGTV